jgi:hypothetical protein
MELPTSVPPADGPATPSDVEARTEATTAATAAATEDAALAALHGDGDDPADEVGSPTSRRRPVPARST